MATKRPSEDSAEGNGDVKRKRSTDGAAATRVTCNGYHCSKKGERETMEDAHVLFDDFSLHLPEGSLQQIGPSSFYAVYDGHGGEKAARYCASNLHKTLAGRFPKGQAMKDVQGQLKRIFLETFKTTDDSFLLEARKAKPVIKDGCTATCLLVLNNALFIANIGDSKALLCRYKPDEAKEVAIPLTKDHSPLMFEERKRIEQAGGNVKDGRVMGMLEVSRSIGDGQYKSFGVSCIPDVKRCTLTTRDRYVLIGCDGLWKAFTCQQAIDFVREKLKDDVGEISNGRSPEEVRWEQTASKLAAEAVRRRSGDNVTVLLVKLHVQE